MFFGLNSFKGGPDGPLATDPRGYRVTCSQHRMDEIYEHHPELHRFWAREETSKLRLKKRLLFINRSKASATTFIT